MQAKNHRLPILGAVAALALCAACGRQKPPAPEPTAPRPAQTAPVPALPVPAMPVPPQKAPAPQSDEERLLAEHSVWWNIQPTGAVLRIRGTRSDLVVTALTERVETRIATGFYTVEISAEGYETWTRRTPLGGTSTNQTVSLFPLPPPPPPKPVAVAAAPKSPPAPYFPKREVRDLRKALEQDSPKSEVASPKSEVASSQDVVPSPKSAVASSQDVVPSPKSEVASLPNVVPSPQAEIASPQDEIASPQDVVPSPQSEVAVVERPVAPVVAVEPPPPVVSTSDSGPRTSAPEPRTPDLGPETSDSTLLPTRLVRGALESTAPGDMGFFSEPMTLSIGSSVRRIDAAGFALNYEDVANAPISVRVRNYDVRGPAAVPAVSPAGVAHLVYRATPHPVTVRFPDLDPEAIPCNAATGHPLPGYDPATRTLHVVPAYAPLDVTIRRRGHRIHTVHIDPQRPGATINVPDVRSIPLTAYGRKGDRQVIDLGDGTGLSLVWVPGGRVEDPAVRGGVITVPRGFWISEHPVTRRQWRAVLGGVGSDGSGRPEGDPASIARRGFAPFAQSLMETEPRMAVRLPRAAELRLAAKEGLRNVKPDAELTLSAPGAAERATGAFHVVVTMGL